MPNLNTSIMGEVEVLLPGEVLCSAFNDIAAPLHERMTAARLESGQLVAIRDILLPKLMSGEIRVRDAEAMLAAAQ